MATELEPRPITRTNLKEAILHLEVMTDLLAERRIYGDLCIRLKFVEGTVLQWESSVSELHKSGHEATTKA